MEFSLSSFSDFDPDNFTSDSSSHNNLPLDSLSDSEKGEDPWEVEAIPADLHKLYLVMYNSRYFVDRHVTTKSKEFATQFFHNLPKKLFRQLTRMDKRSFFTWLN